APQTGHLVPELAVGGDPAPADQRGRTRGVRLDDAGETHGHLGRATGRSCRRRPIVHHEQVGAHSSSARFACACCHNQWRMTELVLSCQGLTRRFPSGTALDGLTIDARPGEVLALLGPNGAGKTTTMRLLNGVLAPDAGTAT